MAQRLYFNGIHAATGDYAFPPLDAASLADAAARTALARKADEKQHLASLDRRNKQLNDPTFAPAEGVDPKNLAKTGWGVITARDTDEGALLALKPLLNLRRAQATFEKPLYCERTGAEGLRPGETALDFVDRKLSEPAAPGEPKELPYYLLIVGSPASVPFRFQYELDVEYAVGRICFETVEEYARYAQSVIAAEKGDVRLAKRAVFFGISKPDDVPTILSATELIAPLGEFIKADQPQWSVETIAPEKADKAKLTSLLGGADKPSLLFTATHGVMFDRTNPLQAKSMGALVCADWPGRTSGAVKSDWYFSGEDLKDDAQPAGLIAFNFACFGGGTPATADFLDEDKTEYQKYADEAFVSYLSRRLLAHPSGGALACVGHVDRAFAQSYKTDNGNAQLGAFKDTLKRLMEGHPIGSAMEPFNARYAKLATVVGGLTLQKSLGEDVDEEDLAYRWLCVKDARNYMVFGDPAVRLPVDEPRPLNLAPLPADVVDSAPVTPPPVPAAPALPDRVATRQAAVSYSLGQDLAASVLSKLSGVVDALMTVEVKTYSMDAATAGASKDIFADAKLRAVSQARLGGSVNLCAIEEDGKLDDAILKVHADLVQKALANRIDMLKLLATAVSGLVKPS